jgi:hypothetical protein
MPTQQEGNIPKRKKQEKRNGHAFHPIMNKGGAHEKTEKAERKVAKRDMTPNRIYVDKGYQGHSHEPKNPMFKSGQKRGVHGTIKK